MNKKEKERIVPIVMIAVIALALLLYNAGVFENMFATIVNEYGDEADLTHVAYATADGYACADGDVVASDATLTDDCATEYPCADLGDGTVKCGSDCNPGDAACKSYTEYLECASDGTLPAPTTAADNYFCDNTIPAIVCEHPTICVDTGTVANEYTCDQAVGSTYLVGQECPLGCNADETACLSCTGLTKCEWNEGQAKYEELTCATSGQDYVPYAEPVYCDTCNTDNTACLAEGAISCTPNAQVCVANQLQTCNAVGDGYTGDPVDCAFGCTDGATACNHCPTEKRCTDSAGAALEGDFYYVTCATDGLSYGTTTTKCSSGTRTDSKCNAGVCAIVCEVSKEYCLVANGNLYGCADQYTYTTESVKTCNNGCSVTENTCNAVTSTKKPSSSHSPVVPRCDSDAECTLPERCIQNLCDIPPVSEEPAVVEEQSLLAKWWPLLLIGLAGLDLMRKNSILRGKSK